MREAREEAAATAERVARRVAADMAEAVPTDAIRARSRSLTRDHAESEQRTHETLEAVHDTLERLVERLATVETELRMRRSPPQRRTRIHAPRDLRSRASRVR